MTRRSTLIGTVVGAALVLAAPAWGKAQHPQDFWNYESQTGAKVADTSPGVAPQELASLYGNQAIDLVAPARPDAVDRAVATRQQEQTIAMLNARERSQSERPGIVSTPSAIDLREKAFGAKREAQLRSGGPSPDVVQRAVNARTRSIREPVVDDRFRIDPTSVPSPVTVTSSGREIEWPQIGLGFGIGLLLAAGLYVAMRFTRARPLAH
jgi:hypothetical protein